MTLQIELKSGRARVRLAPGVGGAIVAFTLDGLPILRPTSASALAAGDVRLASCYPLVPWSNRIRDARLAFGGREHALERNFGVHPHALHGVGWQRAWSIAEAQPHRARLILAHDPERGSPRAWPWPFRATQTFELTECAASRDGAPPTAILLVTLTIENGGAEAFPFGLGWHPFFPGDADTRLCFDARAVWENDATQLPVRRIDVPARWRFDRARTLHGLTLDNVFTGWAGSATLANASTGIRTTLTADAACRYLVAYAPPGADFVALEPVTHETDAFNRNARGVANTGFRTLRPGAAFSCTMRLAASALD